VEDSRADAWLIRLALTKANIDADIVVIEDGEKAIRFFESEAETTVSCPDLILLDINLPRFKGKDVLCRIRAGRCCATPVLVVTSSNSPADRDAMRENGAQDYFRKPSDLAEFMTLGDLVRDLLRGQEPRPGC